LQLGTLAEVVMKNFAGLLLVFTSFGIAAVCPVLARDESQSDAISASEIESLFLQNLYKASTLHVTWVKYGGPTEESRKTQEFLLQMAKSDSSVQPEYIRGLENSLAIPAENRCTAFSQDFFTDRKNFQVRFQLDDRGSSGRVGRSPPTGRFPESMPTPATLPTDFEKVSITSFGRATDEQFRRWDGHQPRPGYNSAIVSTENPEYTNDVPPFAMPSQTWGVRPSWIDQAFVPESLSSRVVGEVAVNGTATTVLERVLPIPGSSRVRTYLIYCDLQRGANPVRIEIYESGSAGKEKPSAVAAAQWKRLLWDGVVATGDVEFPQYVVKEIQLDEFDGTWYPVSGTIDQYCPTGRDLSFPLVVGSSWSWNCSTVEINPEFENNLFSLEFPIHTVFVDHTRGETRVVGDAEEYSGAIIGGIKSQSGSDSSYGWLRKFGWVLGFAALFYSISVYWRRRSNV
jgi:hypothetical protein